MVINESALLRAMREDYKGQGYTVARRAEIEADPESESILLLSANDWMVEIGWKNVSAKIFGLGKRTGCNNRTWLSKSRKRKPTPLSSIWWRNSRSITPMSELLPPTAPGLCTKAWRFGRRNGTTAVCLSQAKRPVCFWTTEELCSGSTAVCL